MKRKKVLFICCLSQLCMSVQALHIKLNEENKIEEENDSSLVTT